MHLRATSSPGGEPTHSYMALRLFGSFELTIDDTAIELSHARERLVALLALMGRMSRSRACALLWPDLDEERARHNLRSSIWRTTAVANGVLTCTHGAVGLAPDVDVDVLRFSSTAQKTTGWALPAHSDPEYASDLLPDWNDEWLDGPRERLRQLRLHLLERSAEELTRAGQHGLALTQALAVVQADPLRESAHRLVIAIHLASGNRVKARQALDTCRRILAADAGVEPAATTMMLLDTPLHATRQAKVPGGPRQVQSR